MLIEPTRCPVDVPLVPPIPLSGLVPADEHDRIAVAVEREQDPEIAAKRPQLLHVVLSPAFDAVDERASEVRANVAQHIESVDDLRELVPVESVRPLSHLGHHPHLPPLLRFLGGHLPSEEARASRFLPPP